MNYLTIAGEKYPCKYGLSAIREVVKLSGGKSLKDLSKLDELPVDDIPKFIHAGLKGGAKIENVDAPGIALISAELEQNFPMFTQAMEIFGQDVSPAAEPDPEGN